MPAKWAFPFISSRAVAVSVWRAKFVLIGSAALLQLKQGVAQDKIKGVIKLHACYFDESECTMVELAG